MVVAGDGRTVLGEGFHRRAGEPHAEVGGWEQWWRGSAGVAVGLVSLPARPLVVDGKGCVAVLPKRIEVGGGVLCCPCRWCELVE